MRPSTFAISFWFCRCSGLLARTRSFTRRAAFRDTVVSSLCRSRASMMISCRNIVVGPAWLSSASSCIGAAACAFSASPPCGGPGACCEQDNQAARCAAERPWSSPFCHVQLCRRRGRASESPLAWLYPLAPGASLPLRCGRGGSKFRESF